MNHRKNNALILFMAAISLSVMMPACKTNEANYRQAYEIAKDKQEKSDGGDEIPTAALNHYGMPRPQLTSEGDTIMVLTEPIAFTPEGGADRATLKRYNVVVGQFRQIFNAKAMLGRLREGGYPEACIVNTRLPLYYVITGSYATTAEASKAIEAVKTDGSLRFSEPLPFILQPAHLAR